MIDRSTEYKSIIMRCDLVNEKAFKEIPKDMEIEFYKKGMEYIWVDIQKSIGEFEVLTDDEVIKYFQKKLMVPVLHWLAVKDEFSNNGYARIVITEVLKIFNKLKSGCC